MLLISGSLKLYKCSPLSLVVMAVAHTLYHCAYAPKFLPTRMRVRACTQKASRLCVIQPVVGMNVLVCIGRSLRWDFMHAQCRHCATSCNSIPLPCLALARTLPNMHNSSQAFSPSLTCRVHIELQCVAMRRMRLQRPHLFWATWCSILLSFDFPMASQGGRRKYPSH